MIHLLYIAIGGAIGAIGRHFMNRLSYTLLGADFPYGTLFANILGSALMGVLIAWLSHHEPQSANFRSFAATGLLGAFTTFSTFSLDAITLFERGAWMEAALYIIGNVVLGIAALWFAITFMRSVYA